MKRRRLYHTLTFALLLLLSTNVTELSAKSIDESGILQVENVEQIITNSTYELSCSDSFNYVQLRVDCTVRVEVDNVEWEVTFYEVTWFQCQKMKLAAWWNRTFK